VHFKELKEIQTAIAARQINISTIVDYYLSEIKKKNADLNAFLSIFDKEAKEQAELLDQKILNGEPVGKLAGLVLGIKDNLCYKNHTVGAASKILDGFISQITATAIANLIAEDAIIIGRLNCDEFAMGASNENSAKGAVKNAANRDYVPGGSSGGSAVAVQAGMCFASLGSDTGGSIRQPASFCGLVGSKATYGKISRWGLLAYASSFDQIGALTQTVQDNALLTQIMAGHDPKDATSSKKEIENYYPIKPIEKVKKIAIFPSFLNANGLDPQIKESTLALIKQLKNLGHEIIEVDFPYLDYMVPCYYALTTAEASSNLSRYNGLTFGYRSKASTDLESTFKKSRTEGFGAEVKRRIMLGTFVLSSNHYDAYYTKAQKVRRLIQDKTNEILSKNDYIIMPTTSTPAFKIGEKSKDPIAMYLADLYTVQANLTGHPAISVPLGVNKILNLPFGIQIIGAHHQEKELFQFAKYLETI